MMQAICRVNQPTQHTIGKEAGIDSDMVEVHGLRLRKKGLARENGFSAGGLSIWRLTERGITELLPLAGCRVCGEKAIWKEHADTFRISHTTGTCEARTVQIDVKATLEELAARWNQHGGIDSRWPREAQNGS